MCSETDDPSMHDTPRIDLGAYVFPTLPLGCEAKHVEARFWAKVDRSGGPDACWLWTDKLTPDGYARMYVKGEHRSPVVHRLAYEYMVGPIPDPLQLDHLCRVRHCVNPRHLEAVTSQENLRRADPAAYQREKTHCPAGHAYDEANTRLNPQTGHRICRACHRQYERDHRPTPALEPTGCDRRIWARGEERRCGRTIALVRWTDYVGGDHRACGAHIDGMKRRWPESLPERVAVHGTLGLSSPWARGAFGPADVIEIENAIPPGYVVGVSGHRTNALVWVIDPEGREVTRWVNQPDAVWAARQAVAFIRRAAVPA